MYACSNLIAQELQQYRAHLQNRRGNVLAEIDREEKKQLDTVSASFNMLRQQVKIPEDLLLTVDLKDLSNILYTAIRLITVR